MEKKKMKIWKKILIFLGVLLIFYLVISVYKYCVLSKLLNTSKKISEISNYHFYVDTENGIYEHWRKDDILKTNIKGSSNDLTMWANCSTGEKYLIGNTAKFYSPLEGEVMNEFALPVFAFSDTVDYELCFNPLFIIYPKKYNNIDCYCLTKYNIKSSYSTESKTVEIIDKKTGFSLYNNTSLKRNVNYDFGTVTDEDVQMPNLSEYEYIGSND